MKRWSEGSLIESVPEPFRHRYGDAAANVVELVRHMALDRRDQPSNQDRQHTLEALADAPAAGDLTRLDTQTDAAMTVAAWGLYKQHRIDLLTHEQVRACARQALSQLQPRSGRPSTDDLALRLVCDLVASLPLGTAPSDRDAMLREALQLCGFGMSLRTIKGLRAQAERSAKRTSTPSPASAWDAMLQAIALPSYMQQRPRRRRTG